MTPEQLRELRREADKLSTMVDSLITAIDKVTDAFYALPEDHPQQAVLRNLVASLNAEREALRGVETQKWGEYIDARTRFMGQKAFPGVDK